MNLRWQYLYIIIIIFSALLTFILIFTLKTEKYVRLPKEKTFKYISKPNYTAVRAKIQKYREERDMIKQNLINSKFSENTSLEDEEEYADDQNDENKAIENKEDQAEIVTVEEKKPAMKIILVGMEDGHSDDIKNWFSMRPDVFYIADPLGYNEKWAFFTANHYCHATMDNCTGIDENQRSEILEYISNMLVCSFTDVEPIINAWNVQSDLLKKTKVSQIFSYCQSVSYSDNCTSKIVTYCQSSSYIVVSALRVSPDMFKTLMEKDKNVYVIHVLQDPRAIMSSVQEIPRDWSLNLVARYLCRKSVMYQSQTSSLTRIFQGRVLSLKYEQFRNFAQFILKFSDKIRAFYFTRSEVNWFKCLIDNTSLSSGSNKCKLPFGIKLSAFVPWWDVITLKTFYIVLGIPHCVHTVVSNDFIPFKLALLQSNQAFSGKT